MAPGDCLVRFGYRRVSDLAMHQSMQVELLGQCPPIEKMDATLSTLKACVYAFMLV